MDYSKLNDAAFLQSVQDGTVEVFGHREHLRLAYLCSTACTTTDEVVDRCRSAIRSVAAARGTPDRYHETITAAWAAIMRAVVRARPGASFDEIVRDHGELMDVHCLERYYAPERLSCAEARSTRLAPDRAPLP